MVNRKVRRERAHDMRKRKNNQTDHDFCLAIEKQYGVQEGFKPRQNVEAERFAKRLPDKIRHNYVRARRRITKETLSEEREKKIRAYNKLLTGDPNKQAQDNPYGELPQKTISLDEMATRFMTEVVSRQKYVMRKTFMSEFLRLFPGLEKTVNFPKGTKK